MLALVMLLMSGVSGVSHLQLRTYYGGSDEEVVGRGTGDRMKLGLALYHKVEDGVRMDEGVVYYCSQAGYCKQDKINRSKYLFQ